MSDFKAAYNWILQVIEGIETGQGHSGRVPRLTLTEWGELSYCLEGAETHYISNYVKTFKCGGDERVQEVRRYSEGLIGLVKGITTIQALLTARHDVTTSLEELLEIREHVEGHGLKPLN